MLSVSVELIIAVGPNSSAVMLLGASSKTIRSPSDEGVGVEEALLAMVPFWQATP